MEKRTILAIVLSVLVVLIFQLFFLKSAPKPAADPKGGEGQVAQKTAEKAVPAPSTASPAPPATGVPAAAVVPTAAAKARVVAERDIPVETPLYKAVFSTQGGALKSFKLKRYRETLQPDAEMIELVNVKKGMPLPLTLNFPESSIDVPLDGTLETDARALDMTKGLESRQLAFSQVYPGQLRIEKVYSFHPDRYTIELEVKVHNLSAVPLGQNGSLNWFQYADPAAEVDSYGHDGPVTYVANDVERQDLKKLDSKKLLGPNVTWTGYESKYFIASLISQNPSIAGAVMTKDARDMVAVSLRGPKHQIPPGQVGFFNYVLFMGPKDYNLLKAQGAGLDNAVDFGSWLKWLAMPLLVVVQFLYGYVHNYGIAIIILTALIKLIFWPLGNISYRSMKEMQKLQPKMKELQEKYKDDKPKLSSETMALYRAHKVNPMSGCLPMLIQIPVFFGLYKALLYPIELRHAPFFWWIQDLSAKDPYYITPIIMGATMWIQQKMTPAAGDPMQQKIMLAMPIIFTFMFLSFPSGLVIYWLFNNLFSIGQQYYINKKLS